MAQRTAPYLTFKDSILKEYLNEAAFDDLYDTTNYNFRVLKAYVRNDSTFFLHMKKYMELKRRDKVFYSRVDSCVHLSKISELKADEAYRFRHSQSFCFFDQVITVTHSAGDVNLEYIEYSHGEGHTISYTTGKGTITIPPYCEVRKHFNRKLTLKEWSELKNRIKNVDYWGLNFSNGVSGLDGSSWKIDGYVKNKFKSYDEVREHSVYRWSPANKPFEDLGKYFIELAGIETMCGDIF